MDLSPIVLFAFNRPHYLSETLRSLKANPEAAASKLFIYCDGAKQGCTEAMLKKIEEVHTLAKKDQWCGEVEVIISPVNKGLATSVMDGVTEVVNKYGKVIVLEDDLVLSPFFLQYMNEALSKYELQDKVASITGYNFPINLPNDANFRETFFLKSTSTLGWGVWKRSWAIINSDVSFLLKEIQSRGLSFEFNFKNTNWYTNMLKKAISGEVSSWGIRWYSSVFLSNKLTLFPSYSLVNHIGNDGTNVRVDSTDLFGDYAHDKPITNLEEQIEENGYYRQLFCEHFDKFNRRKLNLKNLKYYYQRWLVFLKSKIR